MVVWGQVKSESRWLPVTVRVSKTRVLKFSNATTTATATKTSLKKWIRAASNFIALILSRLIRQMLQKFFGSWILNDCIKVQEKKKEVVVFCSRPQQIVKLGSSVHVVVVQRRQRNVQKSVMNEQSCCFANILKPIGFLLFSLLSSSSLR